MYTIGAKLAETLHSYYDKFTINKTKYKMLINTYNLNENMSQEAVDVAKSSIDIFSNLFGDYPIIHTQ